MATTQDEFRKELARRFRAIREAVIITVVDNDALRIGDRENVDLDAVTDFEFETDPRRIDAFMEWWDGALEEGLVEPIDLADLERGRHYTASHVNKGYKKGVKWGNARARDAGFDVDTAEVEAIIQRPVHQEALRTLYTRTFENLEGIGPDAADQIRTILTDGLAEGRGAIDIGNELGRQVDVLRRTRGRTIARTEVMNSHVQATGKRFIELGVEKANIATAEPCEICQEFRDDGPYDIQKVIEALPIHPNCVCVMVPADPDDDPLTQDWNEL